MLTTERKKRFRAIGHNLKPIVTVAGNGLSETVIAELNRALNDHELIKIKLVFDDRSDRQLAIEEICKITDAINVQSIGKVVLLYKAAKKPNPKLSNLLRIS